MRLDTLRPGGAAHAATLNPAPLLVSPGWLRRVPAALSEVLALVCIVFCVPAVILVIGIPIALCVRILLWIGGVLL